MLRYLWVRALENFFNIRFRNIKKISRDKDLSNANISSALVRINDLLGLKKTSEKTMQYIFSGPKWSKSRRKARYRISSWYRIYLLPHREPNSRVPASIGNCEYVETSPTNPAQFWSDHPFLPDPGQIRAARRFPRRKALLFVHKFRSLFFLFFW